MLVMSALLNLLRLVLWPSMWFIMENAPWALECHSGWNILNGMFYRYLLSWSGLMCHLRSFAHWVGSLLLCCLTHLWVTDLGMCVLTRPHLSPSCLSHCNSICCIFSWGAPFLLDSGHSYRQWWKVGQGCSQSAISLWLRLLCLWLGGHLPAGLQVILTDSGGRYVRAALTLPFWPHHLPLFLLKVCVFASTDGPSWSKAALQPTPDP